MNTNFMAECPEIRAGCCLSFDVKRVFAKNVLTARILASLLFQG